MEISFPEEKKAVMPLKEAIANYLRSDKIIDFSPYSIYEKLSVFSQKTPQKYIKERKIAGKMVKYVPYQYPRKVLSIIFNFMVSTEVMHENYYSYQEESKDFDSGKKTTKDVVEAEATVKFTFWVTPTFSIVRTVKAGHKAFKNKATTRADAMKAAISKAWTLAAQSFGICADLDKDPEKIVEDVEVVEPATAKDFAPKEETEKTFGY